jgi:hypothetical protein
VGFGYLLGHGERQQSKLIKRDGVLGWRDGPPWGIGVFATRGNGEVYGRGSVSSRGSPDIYSDGRRTWCLAVRPEHAAQAETLARRST